MAKALEDLESLEAAMPSGQEAPAAEAEAVSSLAGVLDEFSRLRRERDNAKVAAEAAEEKYRAAEIRLIDAMDTADLRTLRTEHGSYTLQRTVFGKVENSEAFIGWADTQGLKEQLTRVEVYKARVNEMVREALANGNDFPPGVTFSETRFIAVRGAK